MKADNSRNTFRPERHYRDVVKQQGRVDVDADWNEQQAINVHRTETEAIDVIGRTGAPVHQPGFAITADGNTLRLGAGRYYVDGILCENLQDGLDYRLQPDRPGGGLVRDELQAVGATTGIVYLDAWLRHITALQDPLIREIALGGPDTTTRTQVVWQVRVLPIPQRRFDRAKLAEAQKQQQALQAKLAAVLASGGDITAIVQELVKVNQVLAEITAAAATTALSCDSIVPEWDRLTAPAAGRLNARTSPTPVVTDLCQLPPRAGYQRTENQLYRVEVHHGGDLGEATFKWSRDNGSVTTTVEEVSGLVVKVRSTGPDEVLGFATNQWVELVDDASDLGGVAGTLLQVESLQDGSRDLTVKTTPPAVNATLGPVLRRWDQSGPTALADGVKITGGWQSLEDGVEVQFSAGPFRTGDYWLIPARTATGEVEWPPFEVPNPNPIPQAPRGIEHHYSRLALVQFDKETLRVTADCRKLFLPLTEIAAPTAAKAMHVKGISWANDAAFPLADFLAKGLELDFDALLAPMSVSAKTLSVAFELPIIPATGFETAGSSRELVPRMSVLLFGEITVRENQVRWLPVRSGLQALATYLRGLSQVIVRVTLKGGAIWGDDGGQRVFLDGGTVGTPVGENGVAAPRTDLVFPTGSGVRASDFESWFLLTLPATEGRLVIAPANVRLVQSGNNFIFVAADTGARVEVIATLTLAAPATADLKFTLGTADNSDFVTLPSSVPVPVGAASASFGITAGRRIPETTVQLTINATAGGITVSGTLTITRP